jgi:mannose-6-phosphate isomerase-like protein (cupin superfamily)
MNTHVDVAVSGASNASRLSVLEHLMPYGEAPPIHVHHDEDEIFHILEGEMVLELGGERISASAGQTVLAPRGVPHGFHVVSPQGVRCLTITCGGFEAMVRQASRPAAERRLPDPVEPTEEMQRTLGAICAEQRIDLLGPPISRT